MGNQLRVVNITTNTDAFLGDERSGISMASSPGIIDLDGDGKDEIVVATSSLDMGQGAQYSIIECINLEQAAHSITWPGYLGPNENGRFEQLLQSTILTFGEREKNRLTSRLFELGLLSLPVQKMYRVKFLCCT